MGGTLKKLKTIVIYGKSCHLWGFFVIYVSSMRFLCRSRLESEPLSRASVSQLSRFRMAVDHGDVDPTTKIEGSVVDRQVVQLGPEIELVAVSSTLKTVKQPLR